MEIYSYHNDKLAASPEEVFSVINDDEQLKKIFSILKAIEYDTKKKRSKGTKFRITLGVRNKTYRFRNEITEYVESKRIVMKTKLKQGVITTLFSAEPAEDYSALIVKSTIESSMGVRIFAMTVKPVVKSVMNKEMKKLEEVISSKN